MIIFHLHTAIWYQVFLSNTTNFQTDLFDPEMKIELVLPLQVWKNLGVMGVKGYSTLPKSPELKSNYQLQFSVFLVEGGVFLFCRWSNQCILRLTIRAHIFGDVFQCYNFW